MSATIKDIAKKLNISTSTVSRALNGSYGVSAKTISLVKETVNKMGYIPNLGAKQLVGKSSNLIGIFIPEIDFEAEPDFIDISPYLHKALRLFGKDIIIFSIPLYEYQPKSLSEWVGMRNLEGCILLPVFGKEHPLMRDALKIKVPCVNYSGVVGPSCSSVVSNDLEGGRLAGEFLLSHGHTQIGYIGGPESLSICQDRYQGFCEAYSKRFGVHDKNLVVAGDFSGASGAAAIMELVQKNPFLTAVFCANDLMAMGAIMALSQHGIYVPDKISVIGYDGGFFTAYTNPPLTTIQHSNQRIGVKAAEMLVEILHGGKGRKEIISPILVQRSSVKSL